MHPVSFVRTSPRTLGENPDANGAVCAVCGARGTDDEHGGYTHPLSLDGCLVAHPESTFFVRVGESEDVAVCENKYLGVRRGDILVVDRTETPILGKLVLAVAEGAFMLCRYTEHEGKRFLVCGNEQRAAMEIGAMPHTEVWGVVVALARGM